MIVFCKITAKNQHLTSSNLLLLNQGVKTCEAVIISYRSEVYCFACWGGIFVFLQAGGNMSHTYTPFTSFSSHCTQHTVFCIMIVSYWHSGHKRINWLPSVLVIKHLSKYRLLFPRIHSIVDSCDSCVIFLVSSQQKKKKNFTLSAATHSSLQFHMHREAMNPSVRYDRGLSSSLQTGFHSE